MFNNEKSLVDKLIYDLQLQFDITYIVRELRSGNNIADVVYTKYLDRKSIVFDDYYKAYFYVENIYFNKKTCIDNVQFKDKKEEKKFYKFLYELEELGYIKIKGNNITSVKKINPATKNIIAIEAKLSDWKSGLEQAYRYKKYANEVYVALSAEYIKNVDVSEFSKYNIGLMSVSDKKLKIPIKAQKGNIDNKDIQLYMSDKFLQELDIYTGV